MIEYLKGVCIALMFVLCAVAATAFFPRAQQPLTYAERIMWDGGGVVTEFIEHFAELRAKDALVVVDGQCISACTMVTTLNPEKVCATPNAQLVFHSAFSRGPDGEKVFAKDMTQIIYRQYPAALRDLLKARGYAGGEHNDLLFIEGDDVLKFMRRCTDADMKAVANLKPRINI